jgi:hypothetical protein
MKENKGLGEKSSSQIEDGDIIENGTHEEITRHTTK